MSVRVNNAKDVAEFHRANGSEIPEWALRALNEKRIQTRRITKRQLRRIIKEELGKALNEGMVANIEKTDVSGAEKIMDPMYRAHSYTAPALHPVVSDDETFIVTLADGTKIVASMDASGSISLYDTEDREIDNKALEQEILNMIRGKEL